MKGHSLSHLLIALTLNKLIRTAKGDRSARCGRVHSAGCRPDAAAIDEEIGYVMTSPIRIDYRRVGVCSHFAGSEDMPTRFANQRRNNDLEGAGRLKGLPGSPKMKIQKSP